jgi:regulator of sirC expression with transglutaminase-like and TPR domain
LSLAILCIALGQRLNLPLYGVALPRHVFVRWESEDFILNMEMDSKGKMFSDQYYLDQYSYVTELKKLSIRNIYGVYINSIAILYANNKNLRFAGKLLEKAVIMAPQIPEIYNNLGNFYTETNEFEKAIDAYEKAIKMAPNDNYIQTNLEAAYKKT